MLVILVVAVGVGLFYYGPKARAERAEAGEGTSAVAV